MVYTVFLNWEFFPPHSIQKSSCIPPLCFVLELAANPNLERLSHGLFVKGWVSDGLLLTWVDHPLKKYRHESTTLKIYGSSIHSKSSRFYTASTTNATL